MNPFTLEVIILPAMLIAIFTFWVSIIVTRSPTISLFVALVKSAFFLVYYGLLFDGTYTFLDDWTYLEKGGTLLAEGVNVSNLAENWELTLSIAGGPHFVYYLFNAYALSWFGEYYFSPVALNILLSVIIAYIGTALADREFLISRGTKRLFFIFLLLHPDILAWSNIMNGKDTLVLLLHVILLNAASLFFKGKKTKALLVVVPTVTLLFFLRFYVPVFFALAFLASSLFGGRARITTRIKYLFFSLAGAAAVISFIGLERFSYYQTKFMGDFVSPIYGAVRLLLTPIPFNTEEAYAFLNLPSLFHWALFPVAILGALKVLRINTQFSFFLVIYFLAFVGFYGVFGELQGPRHRYQLLFAIAVFQFFGFRAIFSKKLNRMPVK